MTTTVTTKFLREAEAVGFRNGIRAASEILKQRWQSYHEEHGSHDPDTGTYSYPGNGDEMIAEWQELEEAILALVPPQVT